MVQVMKPRHRISRRRLFLRNGEPCRVLQGVLDTYRCVDLDQLHAKVAVGLITRTDFYSRRGTGNRYAPSALAVYLWGRAAREADVPVASP